VRRSATILDTRGQSIRFTLSGFVGGECLAESPLELPARSLPIHTRRLDVISAIRHDHSGTTRLNPETMPTKAAVELVPGSGVT